MTRYEFTQDGGQTGSHKYWEVEVRGVEVHVRFGRIGARGQRQVKILPSYEEACAAADKLAQEKVRKGYTLVAGIPPMAAPSRPAAAPAAAGGNPELEAALERNPDDDHCYQVFADWLQTQGDPRGELMAVQQQMRGQSNPTRFLELKKVEAALLHEHGLRLLGTLAANLHLARITWRTGFIRSAIVNDREGFEHALELLLQSPSARFLQELTLLNEERHAFGPALGYLAQHPVPTLRVLSAGGNRALPSESRIEGLAEFLAVHPALRRLSLEGEGVRFTGPLAELTRLELRVPDSAACAATLSPWTWPRLQRLALVGTREPLPTSDALLPILRGRSMPALEDLRLDGLAPGVADAVVEESVAGPLAPRLENLSILRGRCTDRSASVLLAKAPSLRKLKLFLEIEVSGARADSVRRAFPGSTIHPVAQGSPGNDDDDFRADGIRE